MERDARPTSELEIGIPVSFKILLAELPPLHSGQHPILNPIPDPISGLGGAEEHPLVLYFLGGTIASLAAFATRIFTTSLVGLLTS